MQDMGHVVFRLPGDAIFAREQSIARLEGRSVDYGLLHMTGRWAHFHGGFDGMVDGLNRFDLTAQRKLDGVQSVASFSGGLGAYSSVWAGGASAFSAGPRIVQAARVASAAAKANRSWLYALRLGVRFNSDLPGRSLARLGPGAASRSAQPAMSRGAYLRAKYGHLTAAGRRSRITYLAEHNAYRWLKRLESGVPDAHFLKRHGAQTTLGQQHVRAVTGWTPDGMGGRMPVDSSRFISHIDQMHALDRAMALYAQQGMDDVVIRFPYTVGHGYAKGGSPFFVTNEAQVYFRNGRPITAFPKKR